MAEEKINKMSGSRPGEDFDDPHQDYVAAKPEVSVKPETPAVKPEEQKPVENNVVNQPVQP